MGKGWLKKSIQNMPLEPATFLVLGVTMFGDLRDFKVLHSYTLKPHHLKADSPLMVGAIDAWEYDYILVVRESVARRNGWVK